MCRFDGSPWPGAKIVAELKTKPAVKPGKVYPVMRLEVFAGNDGHIPDSLLLDTPESGAWLYELRIEKNPPIQFYLEQGDGSPVSIDGLAFLAGLPGSNPGTPQGTMLLALYEGLLAASKGELWVADGSDGAAWGNQPEGYWMQKTAIPEGQTVTIPDGHQMIVTGAFQVDGRLDVIGDLVIL